MSDLGTLSRTMEIIRRYDLNLQKKYGQNFLIDTNILDKIVAAAELTEEDYVLEIGPGIGTLTRRLSACAGRVTAVEIDKALIPALEENLRDFSNVRVINKDILKVDISAMVSEENGGRPFKVVANLPYYITTPILMELLESRSPIASITVMIQKEVADRMRSGPGTKDYGALSLAVQYYTRPEIVAEVSPGCFFPRPKVGSAVIRLTRHEKPPVEVRDEALLFALIRASFNQRRKTLVNGLANAGTLCLSKEEIKAALNRLGLDERIRGEALTLEQFAALCSLLDKNQDGPDFSRDCAGQNP